MISACSEQNQISKCKGTDYSKWTNCFGKEKMTNGVYEGQYLNGKFHGQGTYTWADGNKYVGEFKDGIQDGLGISTFVSGKFAGGKYVGQFKNQKQHGQGTYTWANGDKYVGEWKDGVQHGQGTFIFANGTVDKGIWENGELVKPN